MSKHHVSHTCHQVLHDIRTLTIDQLEERYDIEVDEEGGVWDSLEGRQFDDLHEWAVFFAEREEQDSEDTFCRSNGRGKYDDGGY